jgi:hypothetical protein
MRILVLIMRGQACTWETFLEILFLRVLAHFAPLKRYHKTSVYAQYKRDERSNIVMKLIGERRHLYKQILYKRMLLTVCLYSTNQMQKARYDYFG